jgi:flagellar export protein FliJ
VTLRPRAVRALRDVRVRLRDAAAASHAVVTAARDQTHLALVREQDALEDYLDEATDILAAASNVHDLSSVGDITGVYKLEIADASSRHDEATAAAETSADQLRDKARLLRRAEKLVERVTQDRAKAEAKLEQRMNDDMTTRKK